MAILSKLTPGPVVQGTAGDELLAAYRRILRVEKPVDISTVVQGTVSCRLVAVKPVNKIKQGKQT